MIVFGSMGRISEPCEMERYTLAMHSSIRKARQNQLVSNLMRTFMSVFIASIFLGRSRVMPLTLVRRAISVPSSSYAQLCFIASCCCRMRLSSQIKKAHPFYLSL
jgi:hypothetical protein